MRVDAVARIADINWAQATLIGVGGFAVVYRVAPGLVAKVGRISPEEHDAQWVAHAGGLAMAVIDYGLEWPVPAHVRHAFCPRHGPRNAILPTDVDYCACHASGLDVLLMAEADCDLDHHSAEAGRAREAIAALCHSLGRIWDDRPANLARDPASGHVVGLDFGQEQDDQ
jgi:hypothetical protein